MTIEERTKKDLKKDIEKLERVIKLLKAAVEYLEQGHTAIELEQHFEKEEDEADRLLGEVYFG